MQVCTQASGKTAAIASGNPSSPSTQQISTSRTPRWCRSLSTASQNFAPSLSRHQAPHCGLTSGGITQVVVSAAKRADLGQIHAHRLRHTAATEMLRAGAPLAEIGQLLRHRTPLTTAIYAKVDRERLRELARPWPGTRP